MKKKRAIIIILLFIFLTFLESGIFDEVLWHGWGGFGDISMTYTAAGNIGTAVLILFIPVSIIIIFLIHITLCIKKGRNRKTLLLDCVCALSGIIIAICIIPDNPVYDLGRQIAAFLINTFNWMEYPIPGS